MMTSSGSNQQTNKSAQLNDQVVRQDVHIRNIRMLPQLTEDGIIGNVVGDLWIVWNNGTTMIASGNLRLLYDICNRENFNLMNYPDSISRTRTLKEFRDWQRKELMPKKKPQMRGA